MADMLSPLASPAVTHDVLEFHGLSTKHSLGQNFLVNDAILQKIVDLAELRPQDDVLEVGPGIGTLTIALLKRAGRVVSVERDRDLPRVLADTLEPWADRFALISKDALDLTEDDVRQALASCGESSLVEGRAPRAVPHGRQLGELSTHTFPARAGVSVDCSPKQDCLSTGYVPQPSGGSISRSEEPGVSVHTFPNKFVANLPYAVAATLVLDFFERFEWLESATVMVQKEVADRMCAEVGTKNYGAYTVKLRLHAEACGRFLVSPNNFFPPPHVDSSVIRLNRRPVLDDQGRELSPDLLRAACDMADAAFASRRKTIANSFKMYFASRGNEGKAFIGRIGELLDAAGIDARRRGETLALDEFVKLGDAYLGMK